MSTEFSKADGRFQSTERIHFGSGAQETGMRMKEDFNKGLDEIYVRIQWYVGAGGRTRERMMKLKRRKHMDDVEVQSMEVPANVQQNEVSDSDQGGQIMNTPPQIQCFTAVNHNQDTPFVKTGLMQRQRTQAGVKPEEEDEEQRCE